MTESKFKSNKLAKQDPLSPFEKGLIGTLAARVLLIVLLLLVVPLSVHTLLMYRESYRNGLKNIIVNLTTMARAEEEILNDFISRGASDLRTIDLLVNFPHGAEGANEQIVNYLNGIFTKIAIEQNYDSLFYQTPDHKGDLVCLIAADPKRVGRVNLMKDRYANVKSLAVYPFLSEDPIKGGSYLFVSILTQDITTSALPGVLTFGMEANKLTSQMSRIQGVQYPVDVAFLTNDGAIFAASSDALRNQPLLKFSKEDLAAIQDNAYLDYEEAVQNLPENGFIGVNLPIYNNAFYLFVALPKSMIRDYSKEEMASHLLRLAVLFVLLGGGGVIFLVSRISKPLKNLAASMGKVAEGDLSARYTHDPMGFEINFLGKDFNQMVESITYHMKEAKEERLAKELLEKELNIGREIQRAIVPSIMPKIGGFDIASGFVPAQEVSGDFYDVFVRSDEKVVLAIADTSGKGIYACLYSLCVRSMLRSFESSLSNLKEILEKTNRVFCLDTGMSGVFVTLWIGLLDPKTGELEYSCCGHPPGLLRKADGTVLELKTSGMALGVTDEMQFDTQKTTMQKSDVLLLYTDGVTEAGDEKNAFYGLNRLKTFFAGYEKASMSFFTNSLIKAIQNYTGESPQFDDLTLLCIKKKDEEEML